MANLTFNVSVGTTVDSSEFILSVAKEVTVATLNGAVTLYNRRVATGPEKISGEVVTRNRKTPNGPEKISGEVNTGFGLGVNANASVESTEAPLVLLSAPTSIILGGDVVTWRGQTPPNSVILGGDVFTWRGQTPPNSVILGGDVITWRGQTPHTSLVLGGAIDTRDGTSKFIPTANATVESSEVTYLGFKDPSAKILNGSVTTTEATYNCVAKILSGNVVAQTAPILFSANANTTVESSELSLNHWEFGSLANATVQSTEVSNLSVTQSITVAGIGGSVLTNNLAKIPAAGIGGQVKTSGYVLDFESTANSTVESYDVDIFLDLVWTNGLKGGISTTFDSGPEGINGLKGGISTIHDSGAEGIDGLKGSINTTRGPRTRALFGTIATEYKGVIGSGKLVGKIATLYLSTETTKALFGTLNAKPGPQELGMSGKTWFQNNPYIDVDRLSGKTNFNFEAYLPTDRLSGKTYFYESSSKVVGLHGGFIAYPGVRNVPVMSALHGDVLAKYGIHDYRAQGLHGYLYATVHTIVTAFSSCVTILDDPITTDTAFGGVVTTFEDVIDTVTGFSSAATIFEAEIALAVAFSSVDTNPPGAFDVLNGRVLASHYINELDYEQQEALNGKVKAILQTDIRDEALNGEFLTILATLIYYQVARTYIGVEPPDEPE